MKNSSISAEIRRLSALGLKPRAIVAALKCKPGLVYTVRFNAKKKPRTPVGPIQSRRRNGAESLSSRIRTMMLCGVSDDAIIRELNCPRPFVNNIRYRLRKVMAKKNGEVLVQATTKPVGQTKNSILDDAHNIIYGDREKTYGNPSKNLSLIGKYWSAHLNTRFGVQVEVTPADVCLMMTMLKLARLANDSTHVDSAVDGAGYLALLDRINRG